METRDALYQKRALRRRKLRRFAACDPVNATDRKRYGSDRQMATTIVRTALQHVASLSGGYDEKGFCSEDEYRMVSELVLNRFTKAHPETLRHVEAMLLRVCSNGSFWDAVRSISSAKHKADVDAQMSKLESEVSHMFPCASRIHLDDPHTQTVIGPLFTNGIVRFAAYPVYNTGHQGSHPVTIPVTELMLRSGDDSTDWQASWEAEELVFSASSGATVRLGKQDLLNRWAGPSVDHSEITTWTVSVE